MVDTAVMVGADRDQAIVEMHNVFLFELSLIMELNNFGNVTLSWPRAINILLFVLLQNYPPNSESPDQKLHHGLMEILNRKIFEVTKLFESRVVVNYLGWRAVVAFLPHLDEASRDLYARYSRLILKSEPPSVERQCVQSNQLADIASSMFLKFGFRAGDKNYAVRMAATLKQSFDENVLEHIDWLGESTKSRAKQILSNYSMMIGFNDEYLSREAVDGYFEPLVISESDYFDNIESIDDFNGRAEKPNWLHGVPAYEVNAFNNPWLRKIIVLAGIIGGLFFDHHNPEVLNYAGLGVIIGHEITHIFRDGLDPLTGEFLARSLYMLACVNSTRGWLHFQLDCFE